MQSLILPTPIFSHLQSPLFHRDPVICLVSVNGVAQGPEVAPPHHATHDLMRHEKGNNATTYDYINIIIIIMMLRIPKAKPRMCDAST